MSESADVAPTALLRTGHPGVDEVLDSMDTVAGLPVADHVAVFERAHEQLRVALAADQDVRPTGAVPVLSPGPSPVPSPPA